jgi:GH24 family phage-related lysozyme (muramidase)
VNAAGVALVKRWEGCRLTAYKCPAGVLTIGYGHTRDVREGQTITQHQADVILESDLEVYESTVRRLAPNATENQTAALTSFAFNLGTAALERSTLLKKFLAGDTAGAAAEFGKWTFAAGKQLPGLVSRRAAERELFITP